MVRVRGLFQKDLKNRSSKDLMILTKMKPATWSMSNEALMALAKSYGNKSNDFSMELERRDRKRKNRKTPRPTKTKES